MERTVNVIVRRGILALVGNRELLFDAATPDVLPTWDKCPLLYLAATSIYLGSATSVGHLFYEQPSRIHH